MLEYPAASRSPRQLSNATVLQSTKKVQNLKGKKGRRGAGSVKETPHHRTGGKKVHSRSQTAEVPTFAGFQKMKEMNKRGGLSARGGDAFSPKGPRHRAAIGEKSRGRVPEIREGQSL